MTTTVLGAGYAGIMAANRLAGRGEEVVLVTPHSWFVERIRLHSVASGARADARHELRAMLNPTIQLVNDTVRRIGEDELELAHGGRVRYETLLYAVGSGAHPGRDSASVAGSNAEPNSDAVAVHRVAAEPAALALRAALLARPSAPVTIVGAGFTGIELAAALRAAGRQVRVLSVSEPTRRAGRAQLRQLRKSGVEVTTGCRFDFAEASPDEITVDAAGFAVPSLAADSGLPVDARGRLIVDDTLTVAGHPRILGAGDAVWVNSPVAAHLRPACATALPMGAYAADIIRARREGGSVEPLSIGYALQCVDLGAGRGHVQFVHADDSERSFAVTGRAGGLLKETISRMTVRWLEQERDRAGKYSWPAGPATPAQSAQPDRPEHSGRLAE